MQRILVVYENAQAVCERLAPQFEEAIFRGAESADALRRELDSFAPEVVFSIKSPGFRGIDHRAGVNHRSVKWFQVGGSGYEHLGGWDTDRVQVTNCAGVLAPYLAETLTGAMIALNGHFPSYFRQQSDRVWKPHEFRPLSEQVLLIVGLGHIGGRFARNAKALGMRVLGIRRQPQEDSSVDVVGTLDDYPCMAAEADVVSIHLRANPQTRHLFDRARFAEMKAGALLLSTARGSIVHEPSLIDALNTGHLRGAYLDVFEEEPLPATSPLWDQGNVMITPHASDNISDWSLKFADYFAANLKRWNQGKELRNRVQL